MNGAPRQLFYIRPGDWTWWTWTITAALLFVGLAGHGRAFIAAMVLTAAQGFILLARDRDPAAFSVQLRIAYLLLLLAGHPLSMRWLYWLPAVGTLVLVVFGYCLLARILSLLPWNGREPWSVKLLWRTFFSAPNLGRVSFASANTGCAGGLCTIEAQVAPLRGANQHN